MKNLILKLLLFLSIVCTYSCENDTESTERELTDKQGEMLSEAQKQCGMPALVNFQERKMMKRIIEQRDKADLTCYVYLFSNQTGKLIYIGRCLGYGLPYSTQYTNPQRRVRLEDFSLPQADPNGLYMPQDARGTWILMIKPDGGTTPVYIEPDVIVSPFKLQ